MRSRLRRGVACSAEVLRYSHMCLASSGRGRRTTVDIWQILHGHAVGLSVHDAVAFDGKLLQSSERTARTSASRQDHSAVGAPSANRRMLDRQSHTSTPNAPCASAVPHGRRPRRPPGPARPWPIDDDRHRNTATTTVFSNSASTCTLTSRRMEVVTMAVSVVANVAEHPIAR